MTTYTVIYADPPWAFKVRSEKGKGRSAEAHYHSNIVGPGARRHRILGCL